MAASAAEPPSFENEDPNLGKGTTTNDQADREKFIKDFPADVRDIERAFSFFTGVPVPPRPARDQTGGRYALAIKGCREIKEMLGDHDVCAVLEAAYKAAEGMTISHPGALSKFVAAEVGRLNLQKHEQAERKTRITLAIPREVEEKIRSLSPSELPTNQEILDICQKQGWTPSEIPSEEFWSLWFAHLEQAEVVA